MGRVLTFVYGVFALSATARATYQIFTKFSEARLAYALSLMAGIIYILATIGLALRRRRMALICVSIEMIGVLAVGTASVLDPQAFPHATVWSRFGQGYGYVPLILPIIGLIYLLKAPKEAFADR